ncbi:MAG: hypothetical protein A2945_04240 [Candidatus Liptonbacteria bacterium RIFCSPLOWO2_01_FULL_52_25]|uniref:Fido domain-containing protein n=1 Tax=Candidatus Liptonbacteria bacterium RIFCSPLOWO2_01_FULL_52_25 TaxID=1798650 RepID=A0A1G2CD82_9BACT|nr:MAG: hypothetical protein A2945_04240 [Candidatus Liptonbacteria bacterium RIFCSPLOWO2_01_FULL_52_25]
MTSAKKTFQPVTLSGVCLIYELLHKNGFVSFPLTGGGKQKVDALVANINGSYFGVTPYETAELRAVAYLYFLIKDHPFTDGNKRTASLVFEVVCEMNSLKPNYQDFTLDALAVFIEKTREPDHQDVIRKLAKELFLKHEPERF